MEINGLNAVIALVVLILGPGGAVAVANRMHGKILSEKLSTFHKEFSDKLDIVQQEIHTDMAAVRDWLKNLEARTVETDAQLREMRAVLEDRDQRGTAVQRRSDR